MSERVGAGRLIVYYASWNHHKAIRMSIDLPLFSL